MGFYTAATWPGIEPHIYGTLVRRSTSKPVNDSVYQWNLLHACSALRAVIMMCVATNDDDDDDDDDVN